jgi:GNAT superfamily N-acetyltransferase
MIDRRPVGFYALNEGPNPTSLEHLWVLPERIGHGIGRALFQHAVGRAATLGATSLTIEADPHAEPFYLHMGADRVGEIASEVADLRRELPLLTIDLSSRRH